MYFVIFENEKGMVHADRFDSLREAEIASARYGSIVKMELV